MSNVPFGTYPAPAETQQEEAVAPIAWLMKCETGPYAGEYEVVERNASHPYYSAPFPVYAHPTPVQKVQESQTVSVTSAMIDAGAHVLEDRYGLGQPWEQLCEMVEDVLTAALEPSHGRAERQWLTEQDIDQ